MARSVAGRVSAWTPPRTCGRVTRPPVMRPVRAEWGGNVLDLVAWLEGCSLRQAALRLQEEWRGAGRAVGEPQRASKGSSTSRAPDRPHPLSFSLRLGWHPYLEERAVDPATAAWFGVGYYAGGGWLRNR